MALHIHGVNGEQLCVLPADPTVTVLVLRQAVAKACQKSQYLTTLLKAEVELDLNTLLSQCDVNSGDVLTAVFAPSYAAAKYVLQQIVGGTDTADVSDAEATLAKFKDDMSIVDDSAWQEALPWITAAYESGLLGSKFSEYAAGKGNGLFLLDQDMPSAIYLATLVDFTGNVAKLKDPSADAKPGSVWKGEWFEQQLEGDLEESSVDELKNYHSLWLHHDSLEDMFTKWALTGDPFPSDYQVRSAMSGEQFIF
mmetsp:Transcript_56446/g.108907  ORF Transcript_56446/g.108907 Transcript_56446/m.108907 type:complete len:253 (-) Transcript_56446:47-805(-)|eukprot:CAMPEP_0172728488 /NCGR_PEP_ID=MMETSP1074-20121228/92269_1 /TAXON_ID=2916 /ORGANISM="Ceratium fusus, Strain PA161109" /LENGTH=252 /DNA_ID=CAMNT_0013555743 /DNA_START=51 /DNA_END=809 /DNA_ORIENTATION=+